MEKKKIIGCQKMIIFFDLQINQTKINLVLHNVNEGMVYCPLVYEKAYIYILLEIKITNLLSILYILLLQ